MVDGYERQVGVRNNLIFARRIRCAVLAPDAGGWEAPTLGERSTPPQKKTQTPRICGFARGKCVDAWCQ